MKSDLNAMRRRRPDGDKTRERIIDAAGELFAQYGYQGTTSKAICQRSKVNQAAVNYHFGSRQELYKEILYQAHEALLELDHLDALLDDKCSAPEQLYNFLAEIIPAIMDAKSWQLRVWAREIAVPSEFLSQLVEQQISPKFTRLQGLIADVTGIPLDDSRLLPAMFSTLAPCLMLLVLNRENSMPLSPIFDYDSAELVTYLHRFLLAGLQAIRV
ncbi:TetR/AcrR family transcriptional regulator [Celerinatantimonas yamalensis]|uniref:TetR/AcrR family transcriptional regulator n=1 Tax=Celerinatantimonas yamalensis TaxID=559956 RepID=A0ABW9G784_9GAMM